MKIKKFNESSQQGSIKVKLDVTAIIPLEEIPDWKPDDEDFDESGESKLNNNYYGIILKWIDDNGFNCIDREKFNVDLMEVTETGDVPFKSSYYFEK